MAAILEIDLQLYGQSVSGISIPIGSTVNWKLTIQNPSDRQDTDLTGHAVTMALCSLDNQGLPVQPPVISRQGTVTDSANGKVTVPWADGDTAPTGNPLPPGKYALTVFDTDGSGNRLQSMALSYIELTAVTELPDTPVTPLPSQPPLGAGPTGPRGVNWLGTWDSATTYHSATNDTVNYVDPTNGLMSVWIAIGTSINVPPPTDGSKWEIFLLGNTGLQFAGPWDSVTTYNVPDGVTYTANDGSTSFWLCIDVGVLDIPPPSDPSKWLLITAGATGPSGLLDWFNIKTYGALLNGTHDDGPAMNAALAAALATGYGGTIYVPPGVCRIITPVTATNGTDSGTITIRGAGRDSIIKCDVGTSEAVISLTIGQSNSCTVEVSDLSFIPAANPPATHIGSAIILTNGSQLGTLAVRRCNFYGLVCNQDEVQMVGGQQISEDIGCWGSVGSRGGGGNDSYGGNLVHLYAVSAFIRRITMLDFGELNSVVYSAGGGPTCGIYVTPPTINYNGTPPGYRMPLGTVDIDDTFLDEGQGTFQIQTGWLPNDPRNTGGTQRLNIVRVTNAQFNLDSVAGAFAIRASHCDRVVLENCASRYNSISKSAFGIGDCTKVELHRLMMDDFGSPPNQAQLLIDDSLYYGTGNTKLVTITDCNFDQINYGFPASTTEVTMDGNIIHGPRVATDLLLTTTSATDVLSYTPPSAGNFLVYVYYRVVTATTNVGINVTWTDATGAQTSTAVPAASSRAVGSYAIAPIFINATAAAIKVTATPGTGSQLRVSANIGKVL